MYMINNPGFRLIEPINLETHFHSYMYLRITFDVYRVINFILMQSNAGIRGASLYNCIIKSEGI